MARAAVLGRVTWRWATVAAVRVENAFARTVTVAVPDWPGHVAGQHVDVRLTAPDGYTATRAYSIAAPTNGDLVELTVEQVPDGEVSPYLVHEASVGDRLEVRGPLGGWFVWRPTQPEPVQLIAGGSGLVPLMSMIREHIRSDSAAPMRLLYSVRDPEAVLYRAEIEGDVLPAGGIDVTIAYTRRAPAELARVGRVNAELLAAATVESNQVPTTYICGPTGFVEAVAELLLNAGHSPKRIRTERFGPSGGPR